VAEAAPEETQSGDELPVYACGAAAALAGVDGGAIVLDGPPTAGGRRERQDVGPPRRPVRSHDHPADDHAEHHEEPMPVRQKFLTPGVKALLGLAMTGLAFGLYRFIFGLGAVTNLDQQHPWGLWIGIDVASGVALAAGGFTSAFLAHVLHREKYHAIARPALLTAMLGYTFVVIGLQADLGRYYNVWHPLIMWQGNSVLFEVGICVMCYLTVLYLEFAPIACERMIVEEERFPRLSRLAKFANGKFEKVMFVLVIAGCTLSCLHQSSLGNLMVIAPSKLHPLWWTPFSPLLFLLSAIAVSFPMVIWESLVAAWSLKLKPEMDVLGPLARFVPLTLGIYLAAKLADMVWRGTYVYLGEGGYMSGRTIWHFAPLVLLAGALVVGMGLLVTAAAKDVPPESGPDVVVLRELENTYEAVPFEHKLHAKMAQMWNGCVTCHHRSPQPDAGAAPPAASAQVPACKSCHPAAAAEAEIHMPSLKGAYHRQCLNCHQEWMHENACVICHKPKQDRQVGQVDPAPDDIVGRMHPPIPEPDNKVYRMRFTPADGGNVLFRHREHTVTFGIKCVNCHYRDNCVHCHGPTGDTSEQKPLRPGMTWNESHGPCMGCHREDRCRHCHYKDDGEPSTIRRRARDSMRNT